jgi:adenylate kinase
LKKSEVISLDNLYNVELSFISMNIILIGVQGSGKGTQAKKISQKTNYCHISTGDLLRNATGELKEKVEETMNSGHLIDDTLMLEILLERIKKADCKKGILLDGFPRTEKQADLLDEHLNVDKVIEIKISKDEAIRRLSGRVHCEACGHNYNINTSPKPKKEGVCDIDGSSLVRRKDDVPKAIEKRISDYYEKTEPVLMSHYKEHVVVIDGEKSIDEITEKIMAELC